MVGTKGKLVTLPLPEKRPTFAELEMKMLAESTRGAAHQ
jgi:hypothetical protein